MIPEYVRRAETNGGPTIERTFTFNGEDTGATRNFVFGNFSGRGSSMFDAPETGGDAFITVLSRAEGNAIRKRISEGALNPDQVTQANVVLQSIESGQWRPQNRPDGSLLFGQTYMRTDEITDFVRQEDTLRSLGVDVPVASPPTSSNPPRSSVQNLTARAIGRNPVYHGTNTTALRGICESGSLTAGGAIVSANAAGIISPREGQPLGTMELDVAVRYSEVTARGGYEGAGTRGDSIVLRTYPITGTEDLSYASTQHERERTRRFRGPVPVSRLEVSTDGGRTFTRLDCSNIR